MSYPPHNRHDHRPGAARPRVNPARVWGGGVAAAVVAALIVVVGTMISSRLLGIRALTPSGVSAYGSATITGYAISAAVAALVATLLLYVLMLSAPEPTRFFAWIAGLFAVIITILPFMYTADLIQQVITAVINLIVGVAIFSLLTSIGRAAIEEVPDPEPYPYEQPRGYDQRGYEPQEHQQRRYDQRGYEPREHQQRRYDPYN
ncbi:DUF6069 family protein [Nonomuraea sp. NPDC005983]|uniref:DUF6069 family protein n=1 Tax=Nonomuraea sp. NPDC005983 TaxID=3155595 RepID=UPI0033AF2D0F